MPITVPAGSTPTAPRCWTRWPQGGVVGVLECATHSAMRRRCWTGAHRAVFPRRAGHPPRKSDRGGRPHGGGLRAATGAPSWPRCARCSTTRPSSRWGEIGLDHHWPVPQPAAVRACSRRSCSWPPSWTCRFRSMTGTPTPKCTSCCANTSPRRAAPVTAGSAEDAAWLTGQGLYLGFGGRGDLQGRQARGQSAGGHRPAVGAAGDRLPLHGARTGARYPQRQP